MREKLCTSSKVMDLNREHFRAIIYFNFLLKRSQQETHGLLQMAFGEKAPSLATVYNWFAEFNRGRNSLADERHEGRPITVATEETIEAVRRMIAEDNRITYREIEAGLSISMTTINKILHEHLGVKKICARWIPHNLAELEKEARVKWCLKMIQRFNQGESNATYDIITGDETWIYCYEPETKRQSMQWVFPGEEHPTKIKRGRSTDKQMIATFICRTGHIASVALPKKTTVTAHWYTTVCLPEVFKKVRERRPNSRILLHHDNASSHKADLTKDYLKQMGVEKLDPPTYSPDLSPCDFFLFPTIKDKMRGLRFDSAEAAIEAYERLISEIPSERWNQCYTDWFDRMQKCINAHGEYFEKQ